MDVVPVCDSDRVGGALLVGDVHPGRREVAHEHHGERRDDPGARLEARDSRADAVEDQAATRSRRIELARPVSGSTAITTPCKAAGPFAVSKRIGIWLRKRWMICSRSTPITPSVGPVSPRSVM